MRQRCVSLGLVMAAVVAGVWSCPSARADSAWADKMLDDLIRDCAYLISAPDRAKLDELNRRVRETQREAHRRNTAEAHAAFRRQRDEAAKELVAVFEKTPQLVRLTLKEHEIVPPSSGRMELPGATGVLLLKIEDGPGEDSFANLNLDFSQLAGEQAYIDVRVGAGTTWALVGITGLPAQRTHAALHILRTNNRMLQWPVDFVTAERARLKLEVRDEDGQPVPAMVRLTWQTGGRADVRPSNAVDIAPQFDAQEASVSRRVTNLPGLLSGEFWCVPGPCDMPVAPGEYQVVVRRGIEHVPVTDRFTLTSGEVAEKTYAIQRWVNMPRRGWYSGDDHVHNRILSDADAQRLMAWVKAEDIHLANVVKMGDINRTWFEQRGFGKAYRVIDGDYVLSPGQECPRTHGQIGHTLSMNTTSMVRDTDRYYDYAWVADTVHGQGGLFGYAHANGGAFFVHRDMSMNIPAGNVDFAEILQFFNLGTDLYYDFLNLGYKVTASAGSDVPWGGTVGEVRLYVRVDPKDFSADAWFRAVGQGHTFVSDGPMIDFRVEEALPGDEIKVAGGQKLKVKARAWGDPGRMLPIKLEIVMLGDVIKSASTSGNEKEVSIEFEQDAGQGFWIAARAEGGDGTKAHTTPIYVVREGLRFWKSSAVEERIAKRLASLAEVEKIVKDAKAAVEKAGTNVNETTIDRATSQLAIQGDELMKRVEAARKTFDELKATAEREKDLRRE